MKDRTNCKLCNGTGWLTEYGDPHQIRCNQPYTLTLPKGKTKIQYGCENGLVYTHMTAVYNKILRHEV